MAQYEVTYQLDEGAWFARIYGLDAVFTQGDTLEESRENIREVIALMIGREEADEAILVDKIMLPDSVTAVLQSAQRHVEEAGEEAEMLTKYGLSARDVNDLLGVPLVI